MIGALVHRRMPFNRLARWQLGLPLMLLLAALLATDAARRLDLWLYDTLVSELPLAPPPTLSLVGIDEHSLEVLGRWPWPRDYHARLIERLTEAGARAIVFDILFTEPAEHAENDRALAAAIERHGGVVLPVHLYPLRSRETLAEHLPIPMLAQAAAALGHVHVELDNDGIARGLYLREGLGRAVWPSLAVAALDLAEEHARSSGGGRIAPPYVNVRRGRVRIPFAGPGGAIPTYSYADVLAGHLAPHALDNHVVFVGATAAGFGDVLPIPLSANAHPLSGVEFHANVYSALVQNALIRTMPAPVTAVFGMLLVILITAVFPLLRPNHTLVAALLLAALPLTLSVILFAVHHLWLPPVALALVCLFAYPLWSGRRLAVLNRFLNLQLEALGREPRLLLRAPESRTPVRLLEQLEELLKPQYAWLCKADENIRGARPEGYAPLTWPGIWRHEGDVSRILLERRGEMFELGLVWDPGHHDQADLHHYLENLPLQGNHAGEPAQHSGERLTQRIQQVKTATLAMADMHSFIGQGFERMPDGVIVTDPLGVIQFANRHIGDWFSLPVNSLPGMPLVRLLDHADCNEQARWLTAIQSALTRRRYRTESLELGGKDLLLHLAPFPLPGSERVGLIANVVDISEVREQQRQYREAIDFISHDVRSPLVSQLALIQQLKRQDEPASVEQLDHVAKLARRSYQLAEEFVQLARAEQLAEIQFYESEMLAIAENAIDAVQDQARAKGISLSIDGDESLWLMGNAELAERAVINLLTNAIAYSPPGSTVKIDVYRAGEHARISIQDNGNGIAPDELPLLFQRFKRSRQNEQNGNHGAGLGLAFVRVVAERHGGWVDVTSTLGQGSTFNLYLPLAAVAPL